MSHGLKTRVAAMRDVGCTRSRGRHRERASMISTCSVFIAASVDGFIARLDGDIEWLHKPEYASTDKTGLSYDEFMKTIDVIVMGRKSFEKALTFEPWPYEQTPVIVLSSRKVAIPDHLHEMVTVENRLPQELVSRLASDGSTHVYVDGGVTVQGFLQARLINEITITHIPVLLGGGIPLFGSIGLEVSLSHLGTTSSSNGFVQTRYHVTYPA